MSGFCEGGGIPDFNEMSELYETLEVGSSCGRGHDLKGKVFS